MVRQTSSDFRVLKGFQGLEERLDHGVVIAIPLAGHRDQDAVLVELGLIVDRAILAAAGRPSVCQAAIRV